VSEVTAFNEAEVESFGIEPMCRGLRIATSTWCEHVRRKADRDVGSVRAKEDERLSMEITRVHKKNFGVYCVRKVWLQLNRVGFKVGRERVALLTERLGFEGAVRGKVVKPTMQDKVAACPFDLVSHGLLGLRHRRLHQAHC